MGRAQGIPLIKGPAKSTSPLQFSLDRPRVIGGEALPAFLKTPVLQANEPQGRWAAKPQRPAALRNSLTR